jgi:tetratricopeptide (TPR) repeat protein
MPTLHGLRAAAFAALSAACAAAPRAQPAVLESLRQAVVSRWEFQDRFPEARALFGGTLDEARCFALAGKLRPFADAAASRPSGAAGLRTADSLPAPAWVEFALGLAEERARPGAGEPEFAAAAGLARGDVGLNYAMARAAERAGMPKRARAWQAATHRAMLERGYVRVPALAKLELFAAGEAMDRGRYQAARQSLESAGGFDPFCPWVPVQNMVLHARENRIVSWDLGYLWSCAGETLHLLRYRGAQTLFLVNLSRWLRLALGLFGAVGLLALFARHFTRIAHPWAERFPRAVEMRVRYLAIALGFTALAVGGAGYAALGILGAALLWKHCARDEKSVLAAVLLGIALVPVLSAWERTMCRHLEPGSLGIYHETWYKGFESGLERRAAGFAPRTREDSVYRSLALSVLYRKQGDYRRARAYAAELERRGGDGLAALNRGNIDMAAFEYSRAAEAFAQARREAPERVETWFNSSQAELYSSRSAEHKKFLDRAADIDAAWVTRWLKDNDESFPAYPATRKSMDPMLGMVQAWKEAWRSLLAYDFLREEVRSGLFRFPGAWQLAAVLAAAAGLWFRFRRHAPHIQGRDLFECRICGRTVCRMCRKGVHCHHCFKTVAGVQDNRVKLELASRLRHRSAKLAVRIGASLNGLVPGVGRLYLGKGAARFMWPLAACLCIGALWTANHPLMEYPGFVLGPLRWLSAAPLILVYAAFNLRQLGKPLSAAEAALPAPERTAAR